MKTPIWNIDGDFDDQKPDLFEDYNVEGYDEKGEEDYRDAMSFCPFCNSESYSCPACNGRKIKKRKP